VILRLKEPYDGAEPAPNSVSALNLLRLSQMTDSEVLRARAEAIFSTFSDHLRQAPSAMPLLMAAFGFYLDTPKQIVIAGPVDAPDTRAMLREVHRRFVPSKIVLLADGGIGQQTLAKQVPFIRELGMMANQATAYVCEDFVCQLPTNDANVMAGLLDNAHRQLEPASK
jgi:uncharacterized protein YyaL (SSP411 family)